LRRNQEAQEMQRYRQAQAQAAQQKAMIDEQKWRVEQENIQRQAAFRAEIERRAASGDPMSLEEMAQRQAAFQGSYAPMLDVAEMERGSMNRMNEATYRHELASNLAAQRAAQSRSLAQYKHNLGGTGGTSGKTQTERALNVYGELSRKDPSTLTPDEAVALGNAKYVLSQSSFRMDPQTGDIMQVTPELPSYNTAPPPALAPPGALTVQGPPSDFAPDLGAGRPPGDAQVKRLTTKKEDTVQKTLDTAVGIRRKMREAQKKGLAFAGPEGFAKGKYGGAVRMLGQEADPLISEIRKDIEQVSIEMAPKIMQEKRLSDTERGAVNNLINNTGPLNDEIDFSKSVDRTINELGKAQARELGRPVVVDEWTDSKGVTYRQMMDEKGETAVYQYEED